MAISKETKISNIEKINDSTKVRIWVDIINKLLDDSSEKEYIFKAYSENGKATYDFGSAVGLPSDFQFFDDNYVVTYGGVVLQPDDYSLIGQTLTFVNGAPTESDYLITIRYVGKKNDIRI